MSIPGWWRRRFMWAEPAVVVVLAGGLVLWTERLGGLPCLNDLLQGNRGAIYGALASIFGALLGFVITAVSIVLGFSSMEQMEVVRGSRHYQTLWTIFLQTTWILALATALALAGLIFDRDGAPNRPVLYASVLTSGWAAVPLGRCVWILEQLVLLVTKQRK